MGHFSISFSWGSLFKTLMKFVTEVNETGGPARGGRGVNMGEGGKGSVIDEAVILAHLSAVLAQG